MIRRHATFCSALALAGCGGLAADGDGVAEASVPCLPGGACAEATHDGDGDSRVFTGHDRRDARAGAVNGAPLAMVNAPDAPTERRLGGPCESPPLGDGVEAESVAVGELSLSESCGAGYVCLTRARPDESACASAALGADDSCPDQHVVPIPPPLAPPLPPLEGLCTCRCDGFGGGADYCSCPTGMTCRELIRTLGTNGAARDYAGSYCLY